MISPSSKQFISCGSHTHHKLKRCGVWLPMSALLGAGVASYGVFPTPHLPRSHHPPPCAKTHLPEAHFVFTCSSGTGICGSPVPTESSAKPSAKNSESSVGTGACLCSCISQDSLRALASCPCPLAQPALPAPCLAALPFLSGHLIPAARTGSPEVLSFIGVMHKSPSDCDCFQGLLPSSLPPLLPQCLAIVTPITRAHSPVTRRQNEGEKQPNIGNDVPY